MSIDSHIHLSHASYRGEFPFLSLENGEYCVRRGTRQQLIQAVRDAGITAGVEPAIDLESNRLLLALAEQYPDFLFPAVGVHPTRTFRYRTIDRNGRPQDRKLYWKQRRLLDAYAARSDVVAVGETGLDYHFARREQHRIRQKLWFVYQIKLAKRKELPLILHVRDADHDFVRILRRYRPYPHGGVCHCFNGSAEQAKAYTDLGFMLGIGGSLLKNAPGIENLEQAVVQTPITSIVLETDGPYVKPDGTGLSKKQLEKARNTSLILPAIARRIAELKNLTEDEVLRIAAENTLRLFAPAGSRR